MTLVSCNIRALTVIALAGLSICAMRPPVRPPILSIPEVHFVDTRAFDAIGDENRRRAETTVAFVRNLSSDRTVCPVASDKPTNPSWPVRALSLNCAYPVAL